MRVNPQAEEEARIFIQNHYGDKYLPKKKTLYTSKQKAQDAHEAIRPCTLRFPPETIRMSLDSEEYKLYQLIWNRFLASQMTSAVYDKTIVDLAATDTNGGLHIFRTLGSILVFPGFLILEPKKRKQSTTLPELKEKQPVSCLQLDSLQHFTEPKSRYTDASLIEELEKQGIGRPSTYASILHALEERNYIEKRETHYVPRDLGRMVTELLQEAFPELLDPKFTAEMENQLDAIEEEKAQWNEVLRTFWQSFEASLQRARKQMKNLKKQEVVTSILCQCSYPFVVKWGKRGSFLACSNYPTCPCTEDFIEEEPGKIRILPKPTIHQSCPHCHQNLTSKNGKFGKFLACQNYPKCTFTQAASLGMACPQCSLGEIAKKRSKKGRFFYGCNQWPNCNFALWDPPIAKTCPRCQFPLLIEKTMRRAGPTHRCFQKGCSYFEVVEHLSDRTPAQQTRS
jgi:DNA topoisomerase-1